MILITYDNSFPFAVTITYPSLGDGKHRVILTLAKRHEGKNVELKILKIIKRKELKKLFILSIRF